MSEIDFLLDNNVKLSVLLDRDRSLMISSAEINGDLVFQPTFLPSRLIDPKSQEQTETDYPIIVYNLKGKRGIAPIFKRRIRIEDQTFLVGDIYPLNSMMSTKAVAEYMQGRDVDGRDVYDRGHKHLKDNVDLESDLYYHVGNLYRGATHFHSAFQTMPYIEYHGPPVCGKTRANYTIASACFHPVLSPDISDASFYYLRESAHCTVSLDERNLKRRDETKLGDFLNNAYKKGGQVVRMVKNPSTGTFTPRVFSVYGPFMYSGAHALPYMTETRTVEMPMRKTLNQSYSDRTDPLPEKPEETQLREDWYLFRLTHGTEAFRIYNSIKASDFGLTNRVWELAHPLVATALLIDEELVKHVVEFFREYKEESIDFSDRDEGKILNVLVELVAQRDWNDDYVVVKNIKDLVVERFEEEAREWRSQRVTNALRLLHFKDLKLSHGYTKVKITKAEVDDWAKRLNLDRSEVYSPDSTPSVSTLPKAEDRVERVETGETISTPEEKGLGREGRVEERGASLPTSFVSTQSTQLDSPEKRQAVLKAIADLERRVDYAHFANLAYELRNLILEDELKPLLASMQREGLIFEAKPDCFKLTRG